MTLKGYFEMIGLEGKQASSPAGQDRPYLFDRGNVFKQAPQLLDDINPPEFLRRAENE